MGECLQLVLERALGSGCRGESAGHWGGQDGGAWLEGFHPQRPQTVTGDP